MAQVDALMLKSTTVFSSLSEAQLRRMVEAGQVTEHATGEPLIEEGVIGHRFRLLLQGAAEVTRMGKPVASVRGGDFVGEVSLLGGVPATATVRCTAPTTCLTIWRERFWELLEAEPAIALRILEVVCRRLGQELTPSHAANLAG